MALKFFESESQGNGSLEFLNDWFEKNPKANGKQFPVVEVKKAQSGKGYMFYTDEFIVFQFTNSKLTKQLIQALEHYASNQDGYQLVVVVDKNTKGFAKFAVDFDEQTSWFEVGNGCFSTRESDSLAPITQDGSNPFIPPVPSTHQGGASSSTRTRKSSPS